MGLMVTSEGKASTRILLSEVKEGDLFEWDVNGHVFMCLRKTVECMTCARLGRIGGPPPRGLLVVFELGGTNEVWLLDGTLSVSRKGERE